MEYKWNITESVYGFIIMIYTNQYYSELEEGEIFPTNVPNEYAVYHYDHIELYAIDHYNLAEKNDDNDDELSIPQINQCTMCKGLRLSKFRYCRSCMGRYNQQWYDIYLDSTDKIREIHAWEYNQGYAYASLSDKVGLHKTQGDPAYVAIHRIRCIIAFQHLLPTHKLKDATILKHAHAAAMYMKAATNSHHVHIDLVGPDINIYTGNHNIYLNMFTTNIEDCMYSIINRIINE